MKKGSIIYKRFHTDTPLYKLRGIQWFALDDDYGTEYGSILKKYKFKKNPKLLDIGKVKIRREIEDYITEFEPNFKKISDPDFQYSGGKENKLYHSIVKKYFGRYFDGTIIVEDDVDSDDLEGATEIVLWKNFSKLLKKIT